MSRPDHDVAFLDEPYNPIYNPLNARPVLVHQRNNYDQHVFLERPLLGSLLFDNTDSDARDHCAAERTFLSWLRLATYMAIVASAILVSFHLKAVPSPIELMVSLPFGLIFWVLSIVCLVSGLSNYIITITKYSHRRAIVQNGWKTHVVSNIVAFAIIAACILLLVTKSSSR